MTSLRLLDTETMFDALVSAAAPAGVTPIQDATSDSNDEVPLVYWKAVNNGQYDHGLWQVTLIFTVIAEPRDMFGICATLYAAVTGWNTPGEGVVPGVGGVLEVTDGAVFDKTGENVLHGKHLTQYGASFNVTVQEM